MKKRWLTVPALVAVAALALPGVAQARWKTLNGPLIQTTGTNLCVCKDGLRVNVGRFRGDGIPWDALRLVVTTSKASPQTGVIADQVVALHEITPKDVNVAGGTRTIDRQATVVIKFSPLPAPGSRRSPCGR